MRALSSTPRFRRQTKQGCLNSARGAIGIVVNPRRPTRHVRPGDQSGPSEAPLGAVAENCGERTANSSCEITAILDQQSHGGETAVTWRQIFQTRGHDQEVPQTPTTCPGPSLAQSTILLAYSPRGRSATASRQRSLAAARLSPPWRAAVACISWVGSESYGPAVSFFMLRMLPSGTDGLEGSVQSTLDIPCSRLRK